MENANWSKSNYVTMQMTTKKKFVNYRQSVIVERKHSNEEKWVGIFFNCFIYITAVFPSN